MIYDIGTDSKKRLEATHRASGNRNCFNADIMHTY